MGNSDQIRWPDGLGIAACILAGPAYAVFLTWHVPLLERIAPSLSEQRSLVWFVVEFPIGLLKFELVSALPIWIVARLFALALDRMSSGARDQI
jgi:hypothetical protein